MATPHKLHDATPTDGYFSPPVERRFSSDRAHGGDIEGALGSIKSFDTGPRHTARRRITALLAIMGPGLIVTIADNDAGGISLFGEAGRVYGLRFLWGLLILAPILYVNQEMASRLGVVTGSGHGRLIRERFGRAWGAFAIGDLLLVNVLTIITEIVGVRFALGYFGISQYISVPFAACLLIAVISTGSFRRWESAMYICVVASLLVIPLALFSHGHSSFLHLAITPTHQNSNSHNIFLAIAVIGSTVAPWQLFFHQSNVVDKRITSRWLNFERTDTVIGTLVFTASAAAIVIACAMAFSHTNVAGTLANAGVIAHDLRLSVGPEAGAIFALILLNGSILGASAVTLATSYAVGDYFGLKHSLHRSWRDARVFHWTFAGTVLVAGGIVLIPGTPLGLLTASVQALAGVLLPSASVLLLLLCNDKAVLGPWTNPRWLNLVATTALGLILGLSGLLVVSVLIPDLSLTWPAIGIGAALVVVLAVLVVRELTPLRQTVAALDREARKERSSWSMPDIERLDPPIVTAKRTFWLFVLRGYLIFSTLIVILRFVRNVVMH